MAILTTPPYLSVSGTVGSVVGVVVGSVVGAVTVAVVAGPVTVAVGAVTVAAGAVTVAVGAGAPQATKLTASNNASGINILLYLDFGRLKILYH